MTVETGEAAIQEKGKAIVALARAEDFAPEKIEAACETLLPVARGLAAEHRKALSARVPALAEWLKDREEPKSEHVEPAPMLLFGKNTEEGVLARWREQVRVAGSAVEGLLKSDDKAAGEWLYWHDMKDDRKAGRPFYRAEQIRDCAKEIQKLARLLRGPRKVTRLSKGKVLFADGFSGDLAAWKTYGGGEVAIADGRLKVNGKGVTVWLQKDFGDATAVSYDYNPVAAKGGGAGALFAFPARPMPNKDFDASAGDMVNYNHGIETYHVSLYRGDSGRTNLRRTGHGLRMLSSVVPDTCGTLGKTYRITILHHGVCHQVLVDGVLIHAFVDAGTYGPPLKEGRFGLRHFSAAELEAYYDNVEVSALVETTP